MKKAILTSITAFGFCLGASAGVIAQWDFNDNPSDGSATTGTLNPVIGTGIAAPVGGVNSQFNAPAGSSDPLGEDVNNSAWRLNTFAAQGTENKARGAQFTVDTTGYENITLAWDHANSATANKYYRVQYSIDNGATWVDKDVIVNNLNATWNNPIATVSFATVPGANNNPNFGVRIVSEFQSTAVGGLPSYVPVGTGNYAVNGTFRLDMVTFNGDAATGEVNILQDPASQTVAVGQPAAFEVVAGGGTSTITYQWRKNEIPIPNATNSTYMISQAQLSHAGPYDVVVTNNVNSRTSIVATLTVRDPLNLAWTGLNSSTWDTSTVNWLNTNSLQDVVYVNGDRVLFDSRGAAAALVYLAESFTPSSVTVDADFDYTFRYDLGGKIAGPSGLTKRGSGTLILTTDNTYTGPTVIQAGTLQIGGAEAHGSVGTGPVTNNGALVFNRSDNIAVANNITGSGSITNLGKTITLVGTNVYNGPIAVNSGTLALSGNHTVNSAEIIVAALNSGAGGATRFSISGGMTVGSGTAISAVGSAAAGDLRVTALSSSSGTNTFNGPIYLNGSGPNNLLSEGVGTELRVNGDISGTNLASSGSFFLRGATGSGVLNGTINLPGIFVHKTDSGTWTINSTGNAWAATTLAVGTLRIGANNALPVGLTLQIGQVNVVAALDLGGFNQQVAILVDSPGTLGPTIITNSSLTANSTLTVGSGTFSGIIADSAAGPKTGLTLNGTSFTLGGLNTYSGETTVAAGTLALGAAGEFPNSTVINLAGGALDVSARGDATLTLGAAQTLKGNGAFTITGNLVNNGTIELKVGKTGGTVSNDKVTVTGQATYGGTLRLVLSGQNLSPTDTLPVFAAGSYNSIPFAAIEPAIPAPGLTWDTSTLALDGVLRIAGTAQPTFGSAVLSPSGTDILFSGTGGTANGTFSIVASSNLTVPIASWTPVKAGSFDSSGNFSVTIPIEPGETQKFFSLQAP